MLVRGKRSATAADIVIAGVEEPSHSLVVSSSEFLFTFGEARLELCHFLFKVLYALS